METALKNQEKCFFYALLLLKLCKNGEILSKMTEAVSAFWSGGWQIASEAS